MFESRPDPLVQRVTVTDINMSFNNMVVLMVKAAIASIPALFVIGFMIGMMSLMFAACVASSRPSHSSTPTEPTKVILGSGYSP